MKEYDIRGVKGYYINDEPKKFISIEYEIAWDPTTTKSREIWNMLVSTSRVEIGAYPNPRLILTEIKKILAEKYTFLETIGFDGGGLEFNIAPSTLEAHKENYGIIKALMEDLLELGFSDKIQLAGIHLNVDYGMLGPNKPLLLRKLVQFVFNNRDFIVSLSHRQGGSTILADMDTWLGDAYDQSDKDLKYEEFIFHKNLLEEFFTKESHNSSHSSVFNLSLSKRGRHALEVRWFGTTLDITQFFRIVESGFALIDFCLTHDYHQLYTEDFCKYIANHASRYRELHDMLLGMPNIRSYAILR